MGLSGESVFFPQLGPSRGIDSEFFSNKTAKLEFFDYINLRGFDFRGPFLDVHHKTAPVSTELINEI